jgi:hypothetical protein
MQPVRLLPINPPPLESYDKETGTYKRELDHRLNVLTSAPPTPKYQALLPIFQIGKIALSVCLELDNGQKHTIEIIVDSANLNATIFAFEGRLAACTIASIRPLETQMEMIEAPRQQTKSQATTLDLESRLRD